MHLKPARAAARAAAFGGVLVLGLGSAQAAMASPENYHVPCSAGALNYALDHVSSGSTLFLAPGCTYYLHSGLTDNKDDLTIVGDGAALVGGGSRSDFSILTVNCMKTLTLDDVKFSDGSVSDNGGAIDNDGGHITINGGIFTGNSSENGAIESHGSGPTLTVNDATFTGNGGEYGGGIENASGSTATISDTFFGQNGTADYGGAVENDGTATITGSSFLGNTSRWGGAIHNDGTLTQTDDIFIGNRGYEGGAIFNTHDLTDNGSRIVFNAATYEGGGIWTNVCIGSLTLRGTGILGNVFDNVYRYDDC